VLLDAARRRRSAVAVVSERDEFPHDEPSHCSSVDVPERDAPGLLEVGVAVVILDAQHDADLAARHARDVALGLAGVLPARLGHGLPGLEVRAVPPPPDDAGPGRGLDASRPAARGMGRETLGLPRGERHAEDVAAAVHRPVGQVRLADGLERGMRVVPDDMDVAVIHCSLRTWWPTPRGRIREPLFRSISDRAQP